MHRLFAPGDVHKPVPRLFEVLLSPPKSLVPVLSPTSQTQPEVSAYPSGRSWQPLGAPALGAVSLEGRRRGAMGAPRLLTARTLHFPRCFPFTCNWKNSRSSLPLPTLRLPGLAPSVSGWRGRQPRCLWKLHLALLQNKFLSVSRNGVFPAVSAHKDVYSQQRFRPSKCEYLSPEALGRRMKLPWSQL